MGSVSVVNQLPVNSINFEITDDNVIDVLDAFGYNSVQGVKAKVYYGNYAFFQVNDVPSDINNGV